MNPQSNFINHLAAAAMINTTTHTATVPQRNTTTTTTSKFNAKNNVRRTPEPPPAPILSSPSPSTVARPVKPNQGTAPMDLENDDNEIPSPNSVPLAESSNNMAADKAASLNLANGSVYLNSLLTGQIPGMNPAFMFFPGGTGGNQTTANNLLESTTMMAVMQQMQQFSGYGNGALADPNAATMGDATKMGATVASAEASPATPAKEIIKTNSCILFPPNPSAPPPTIRDRPPGCRTVFVGGLPEQITEEILREIFESCGEISTLRMSKKNFCHIRFRNEESIDRAIYLSGYRLRLNTATSEQSTTFARLHVDYAQARDDQYDYQCKQRQLQREQRHRERMSVDRVRSHSQSPPPIPHYSDHEASLVAESLRNNETFIKAVQTMTIWLERGDCSKRNANVFYSMIQSTHAHVRRLTADKQVLEEDLRKANNAFRKQMQAMSAQFTQIEKVFNAALKKKVWDHFTKAQRKNIDQWKKLATELRSIQIDDDEMEMSDEDRDYQPTSTAKRRRYDSDNLKEENDSLRCQLEAMRNEMSLERTDLKCNSDFREKQMKVLQETIRNMQTQLLQTKLREQKDAKHIDMLEKRLKEAGVKQLLLKTKIRETNEKLRDREMHAPESMGEIKRQDNSEVIDIDVDKNEGDEDEEDDVKILEDSKDMEEPKTKFCEEPIITAKEIVSQGKQPEEPTQVTESKSSSIPLDDAKIIALTTAFLLIQPLGTSTQAICLYIKQVTNHNELQESYLNNILFKYDGLFKTDTLEKESLDANSLSLKWRFCGLVQQETEAKTEEIT
ncbi:ecto-NOX disulfide-thiol exchanger 2 isoform X2 [Stomoxys calcitrans]|nr:ecto-NOX disulfide-thiol exchanger 2 isoform X2 [Stomoxys calcitrans]